MNIYNETCSGKIAFARSGFPKKRKLRSVLLAIIAIAYVLVCWLLFPFLTYNSQSFLHCVPVLLLIVHLFLYKNRSFLFLGLLNPAIALPVYYTIKPTVNYLIGDPTIIKCTCYVPSGVSFDENSSLYIEYFDDDCDWQGFYYYTLEVNNFVTKGLVDMFGNPIIN